MADLTGAELDVAVARVMGLRDVYEEDETVWRGDGSVRGTVEWRPDTGGAAAWEVLEWARGQGYDVQFDTIGPSDVRVRFLRRERPFGPAAKGYGSTDAIALCRAVVALGEA